MSVDHSFHLVDVEQLRRLFNLAADGSLTWVLPPKQHPDLRSRLAGSPMLSRAGKRYWVVKVNGHKVKRSHIVFCLTHGHWPANQIDHKNGNSLDDHPGNLREATTTQNAWNHRKRAKRSSLPMGVRALAGRFQARIGVRNKQITLGAYDTPDEAACAYQRARVKYFGEFA